MKKIDKTDSTDELEIALGSPFPEKQIIDIGYFENRHIKKRFMLLLEEWTARRFPFAKLDDENVKSWFKW